MKMKCWGCDAIVKIADHEFDGGPALCASCTLAEDAGRALDLLERGKVEEALAEIEDHIDCPPEVTADAIIENLIYEAGDYVRRGDLDEAMHRLRLAAHPKWSILKDCKEQYETAMAGEAA